MHVETIVSGGSPPRDWRSLYLPANAIFHGGFFAVDLPVTGDATQVQTLLTLDNTGSRTAIITWLGAFHDVNAAQTVFAPLFIMARCTAAATGGTVLGKRQVRTSLVSDSGVVVRGASAVAIAVTGPTGHFFSTTARLHTAVGMRVPMPALVLPSMIPTAEFCLFVEMNEFSALRVSHPVAADNSVNNRYTPCIAWEEWSNL